MKNKILYSGSFFKSQPDQVLKRKITVESDFRWKWNNYLATAIHRVTDKFCCLPLRKLHIYLCFI